MPLNLALWRLQRWKHPPAVFTLSRATVKDQLDNPRPGLEKGSEVVDPNRLRSDRLIKTSWALARRDHIPERDATRDQNRAALRIARLCWHSKQRA